MSRRQENLPGTSTAVEVAAFGCFTGTAARLPFAGQLLSQLGGRMITGTVDLVREDLLE